MKKCYSYLLCVSTLVLMLTSCEKTDDSGFKNKLTLGTGINPSNYFELTDVGTTFTRIGASAVIYFRLESKDDMEGATVLLDFETLDGGLINTISRPQAQSYGHIMVSSFEWMWDTGTYKIKAYLDMPDGRKFIASIEFEVQ
jgi:hypothetical protein